MSDTTGNKGFSEEEDRIYRKYIEMIRSSTINGIKFDVACGFIDIADKELKQIIIDDALKIEIAELHFGKRMALNELSRKLGVSMERLLNATREMMEEIMHTGGDQAKCSSSGSGTTIH